MRKIENFLRSFILGLASLIILFPVGWAVMSSLKPRVDIFSIPPVFFFRPTLSHFIEIFTTRAVFKYILNSTIIASFTTVISVFVGSIAAYSVARFKFFGSNSLLLMILLGYMIPPITFVVPYFMLMRRVGLIDTYIGVIITHICFNLPFVVWMMRSFFMGLPREIEEAAVIDGCTQIGAFLKITLPLGAPGLATAAIFCFLGSWNEFLYAFILTSSQTQTLPVLAASFVTPVGVRWGQLFSLIVIVISPMLVLCMLVRNYFVKGLTLGAIKG